MAQKGTDNFKAAIKAHLDKMAEAGDFALSYASEGKSLDECIDYILTQVKASGCAGFTDEENPGEIPNLVFVSL